MNFKYKTTKEFLTKSRTKKTIRKYVTCFIWKKERSWAL